MSLPASLAALVGMALLGVAGVAAGADLGAAEAAYKAGDYGKVLTLAEPAAKEGDAAALMLVGKAQMRGEAYDKALQSFAKVIEIAPTAEGAHYFRGTILAKRGKTADAETELMAEVEITPGCGPCHMTLAQVRRDLGKKSLAAQSLLRCLDLDDGDLKARRLLAKTYLELKRPSDAALHAGKLPKADPDRVMLQYNAALLFYGKKQDSKAVAQLREVLAGQPEHGKARYLLGLALARQGKRDEAREELQSFLAREPSGVDADNARKVLATLQP